jgi:hypothetical protein
MLVQENSKAGASNKSTRYLMVVFALAVIAAFLMPATSHAMDPKQIRFMADGVVPLNYILPPPQIPEGSPLAALIMSGWQVHQRLTFIGQAANKDILTVQVYLINETEPLLAPVPAEAITISMFLAKINRIEVSDDPSPNFTLTGKVIKMIVPSPFGDLVGATAVFTAGLTLHEDGNADYELLGGSVAGSHTTYSQTAKGSFRFHGSYWRGENRMYQEELEWKIFGDRD